MHRSRIRRRSFMTLALACMIACAQAPTEGPATSRANADASNVVVLTTTSGGSFTDPDGNTWTLTSNGTVQKNGQNVPGGYGTSSLALVNGAVYGQDASSGQWYAYADGRWVGPQASPIPKDSGPTVLTPSSGGSLTDSAGNTWTLTQDGRIQENGGDVPGGSGTSALTYVNGTIWGQDSSSGGWYTFENGRWNGPQASPLTTNNPPPEQPTPQPPPAPPPAPVTGNYTVQGSQIFDPNGNVFMPRGVAINAFDQGWAQGLVDNGGDTAILNAFPTANFVRIMTGYGTGAAISGDENTANMYAAVTNLTNHGMVVIFTYFAYTYNATGAELDMITSHVSELAAGFKDNNKVWFATQNEPGQDSNWAPQVSAIYNAARNSGNTQPISIIPGSGYTLNGIDTSVMNNMTNIFWELHNYMWEITSGPYTGQSMDTAIAGFASSFRNDHYLPVLTVEYGNSTDGNNIDDPNNVVARAVNNAVSNGVIQGCAAWAVLGQGGTGDNLTTDNYGNLSGYGQVVRSYMP